MHPSVLDNAVQSGLVYIESGSFVPAAASCFWRPGSAGHDAHRTSYVSATVRPHPTGSGILTDFHVFQGTAPAPGVVLRQLNSKQIRLQDKTAGAASWRHAPFLFAQRLCISSPEGYSGVANDAPTTCRNSWGARGSRDVLSMSTSAAGQPDALHAVEQARARHDTRGGATLASRSTTGALVTAAEALRMFAASGGRETAVSLSARHSGPAPGKAEERVEMEGAIERGIAGMAHAAATEMQKAAFAYPPRSGTDSFISFAPLRAGVSTGGSVLSGDQGPGGGVTVVTGGTGALGALLARAMVRSATPARSYPRDANAAPAGAYRGGILLLGRTGRPRGPESDDLEGLCAGGANVLVGMARCDAAVNSDVELLTGRSGVVAGLWLAVRGVVHAAGLLRDGLTRGLTSGAVREVAAPKVTAMRNLAGSGTSLWGHPLSAAVATSSVSALVGFLGQASYAAANSAMEAGVLASRQAGVPWSAVQLGALAAVGMAARSASGAADVLQRTQSWGLGCLRPLDALSALHSSLLSTQAGAPGGDVTVATPFDFPTVRSRLPAFASRHTFDEAEATVGEDLGDGSAAADVAGDASRDAEGPRADGGEDSHKDVRLVNPAVAAAVIQALKDVTGRAFGVESSLAGVGIGSVRAARLSNRIAQQLGVKVPPTLVSCRRCTAHSGWSARQALHNPRVAA